MSVGRAICSRQEKMRCLAGQIAGSLASCALIRWRGPLRQGVETLNSSCQKKVGFARCDRDATSRSNMDDARTDAAPPPPRRGRGVRPAVWPETVVRSALQLR